MNNKKTILVLSGGILGISFLLFAALVVHIAIMVKSRKPLENATVQMARVNFKEPMDSGTIASIEHHIKAQKGVKDVYYSNISNILIYSFDARSNTSQSIYNNAIKSSSYYSERFLFAKNEQANGCPVLEHHSFYGKLTDIVEKMID